VLSKKEAGISGAVVTETPLISKPFRVLIDSVATHSFIFT